MVSRNDKTDRAAPGRARSRCLCDGQGVVFFTRLAEPGLQGHTAKDQVVMAGLCLAGSYGGGRKLTADGKSFSLKLLDLPLTLALVPQCGLAFPALMLIAGQSEGRVFQRQRLPPGHSSAWDSF